MADVWPALLGLCSGMALFLYSVKITSGSLQAIAGDKLKNVLAKLTGNRILGVAVGAGITALIQSSTATSVMAVGFVNAGLMNLYQALWVIMGANIGTNITAQLIAFDVTEEYRLTQELREKQHRARIINARLKALNSTIQYIIMDKETLRIKMHIHDSLGKTLLMTRRYLAEPEKTDLKEVISLWGRNISMLKNEKPEDWQEPHFVSFHHAEAMGIDIKIKGELPEDESLSYTVDSAITAHVTNVLRHAGGDIAYISCEKTAEGYVMRFTNNGKKPESPVEEKGGLVNLRRLIEGMGGSMEIHSFPEFEMIIHLPEHIEEEW